MNEMATTSALTSDLAVRTESGTKRKRERSRTTQRAPNKTPEQYAFAIRKLAHPSTAFTLYPGVHFEKIADFLTAPHRANYRGPSANCHSTTEKSSEEGCIVVYNFGKNESPVLSHVKTNGQLEKDVCGPFDPDYTGRLLFLQGHQPADWLNQIGARYSVNYEFFRRHMDFDCLKQRPDNFVRPTLPSDFSNMIQISLTTLGSRHTLEDSMTAWHDEDIGTMRRRLEELIQDDLKRLANPHKYDGSYGESMVRRFTIHDGRYFSLEQDISVYIGDVNGFWIMIIWSDFGHDLSRDTLADALSCEPDDVRCLPIFQRIPPTPVSPRSLSTTENHDVRDGKATISQNARSLAFNYGQDLDNDIMASDTFYLLTDMLRFFIASEAQFLLMLRSTLEQELEMTTDEKKGIQKTLALLHLNYNRECLTRHVSQLDRLHAFVTTKDDLEWPRVCSSSEPEQKAKADRVAASVQKDLAALLRDAKMLSKSFDAGMNLLMNSAMTDESQRAIAQAERVTKLTALAFFFIPLSFTASVFGMNFKEFTDSTGNKLHVWVWVLTSLVVTMVAYLSLNSSALRLKDRALLIVPGRKRKAVEHKEV